MSLKLVIETIKRVSPENKEILNKHVGNYLMMDNETKDTLIALCYIMLDELGEEE